MKFNRSLYKTITWRITASSATILLVYLLSGEIAIAGSVAILEVIVKTVLYYIHERFWEKVDLNSPKETRGRKNTKKVSSKPKDQAR